MATSAQYIPEFCSIIDGCFNGHPGSNCLYYQKHLAQIYPTQPTTLDCLRRISCPKTSLQMPGNDRLLRSKRMIIQNLYWICILRNLRCLKVEVATSYGVSTRNMSKKATPVYWVLKEHFVHRQTYQEKKDIGATRNRTGAITATMWRHTTRP